MPPRERDFWNMPCEINKLELQGDASMMRRITQSEYNMTMTCINCISLIRHDLTVAMLTPPNEKVADILVL